MKMFRLLGSAREDASVGNPTRRLMLQLLVISSLVGASLPASAAPGGNPGRPHLEIDPPWITGHDQWCSSYSGSAASPCATEVVATPDGGITGSVELSSPQAGQAPSPAGRTGEVVSSVTGTAHLRRPAQRIDVVVTVDVRAASGRFDGHDLASDACSSYAYLESEGWHGDCRYCTVVGWERVWLARSDEETQAAPGERVLRYSIYDIWGAPIPAGAFSVIVEGVASAQLGIGATGHVKATFDAVVTSIKFLPDYL